MCVCVCARGFACTCHHRLLSLSLGEIQSTFPFEIFLFIVDKSVLMHKVVPHITAGMGSGENNMEMDDEPQVIREILSEPTREKYVVVVIVT